MRAPIVNGATGLILVEGDCAVGTWAAGPGYSANIPYDVNNRGLIHVVSTLEEQPSCGLLIANIVASNLMQVIDSGDVQTDFFQ